MLRRGVMWTATRLTVEPTSDRHHDPESQPARVLAEPEIPVANLRNRQQPREQVVPRCVELILAPDRNLKLGQQLGFPALGNGRIDPQYEIAQVWFRRIHDRDSDLWMRTCWEL
jgi:hypothetical protein